MAAWKRWLSQATAAAGIGHDDLADEGQPPLVRDPQLDRPLDLGEERVRDLAGRVAAAAGRRDQQFGGRGRRSPAGEDLRGSVATAPAGVLPTGPWGSPHRRRRSRAWGAVRSRCGPRGGPVVETSRCSPLNRVTLVLNEVAVPAGMFARRGSIVVSRRGVMFWSRTQRSGGASNR